MKEKQKSKDKKEFGDSYKKRKKKKIWKKILLVVILLLLVIAGGVFAYKTQRNGGGLTGMLATAVGHDEETKKNLEEFRVLLLGISTDQAGAELTDTIMVASYNPNTQKATLLSIPRDTYTGKNPAKATAYEKINSLYGRKSRPDETLEAVNQITGLNIEYYAVVKTEGLIELVDAIGGVKFDVPIDMDYDDTSQDLHIHLKAGDQLLDGDKAEQLVRFRHNNNGTSYPQEYGDNDTGRMRTQREFIKATIKQTLKPENIFKIGKIVEVADRNLITNVDLNAMKDYIPYAVKFNMDDMLTAVIPGVNTNKNENGTWVFVHDKAETKKMVQELFIERDAAEIEGEETAETEGNTSEDKNALNEATSGKALSKKDIKIEVLNGTGESKKLQQAVDELKGAGFKVTMTGTTNTTSKTAIINKKDITESIMKTIKEVVGIGIVQEDKMASSKIDVTIILGKDY